MSMNCDRIKELEQKIEDLNGNQNAWRQEVDGLKQSNLQLADRLQRIEKNLLEDKRVNGVTKTTRDSDIASVHTTARTTAQQTTTLADKLRQLLGKEAIQWQEDKLLQFVSDLKKKNEDSVSESETNYQRLAKKMKRLFRFDSVKDVEDLLVQAERCLESFRGQKDELEKQVQQLKINTRRDDLQASMKKAQDEITQLREKNYVLDVKCNSQMEKIQELQKGLNEHPESEKLRRARTSYGGYMSREQMQAQIKAAQEEINKEKQDKSVLEMNYTSLQKKSQELQEEYNAMKKKLNEYTESWGRQLSQSASADDTHRENLSSRLTPMRIAEDYKKICNKFSVADILEKSLLLERHHIYVDIEEVASRITCEIFEVVSCIFKETHKELHRWLHLIFEDPITRAVHNKWREIAKQLRKTTPSEAQMTTREDVSRQQRRSDEEAALLRTLDGHYRGNWDTDAMVMTDYAIQMIIRECGKKLPAISSILQHVFRLPVMCDFVSATCQLCWSMCLMHPPMKFATPGINAPYDETQQMAYINSQCNPRAPGAVVMYYIYPCLVHNEHVHERGYVVVGKASALEPTRLNFNNSSICQSDC